MNAIQQWAPGGILDLSGARNSLARCYMEVRKTTESICRPLSAEDQMVQSMPDASPAKWHQAHTTWFFETFLLIPYLRNDQPFHPGFPVRLQFLLQEDWDASESRVSRLVFAASA